MENPHEQVQNALFARIISNMERLNESVVVLNHSLEETNKDNVNIEILAQMWENYIKNSSFHIETTGNQKPPL